MKNKKANWIIYESEVKPWPFRFDQNEKAFVYYVYKRIFWKWFWFKDRFYGLDMAKEYIQKEKSKLTDAAELKNTMKVVHSE